MLHDRRQRLVDLRSRALEHTGGGGLNGPAQSTLGGEVKEEWAGTGTCRRERLGGEWVAGLEQCSDPLARSAETSELRGCICVVFKELSLPDSSGNLKCSLKQSHL